MAAPLLEMWGVPVACALMAVQTALALYAIHSTEQGHPRSWLRRYAQIPLYAVCSGMAILLCMHYLALDALATTALGRAEWSVPVSCVLGGPRHPVAMLLFMFPLLVLCAIPTLTRAELGHWLDLNTFGLSIQLTYVLCLVYIVLAGCEDAGTAKASVRSFVGVSAVIFSWWTLGVFILHWGAVVWGYPFRGWIWRSHYVHHMLVFYAMCLGLYKHGGLAFMVPRCNQLYALAVVGGNTWLLGGLARNCRVDVYFQGRYAPFGPRVPMEAGPALHYDSDEVWAEDEAFGPALQNHAMSAMAPPVD